MLNEGAVICSDVSMRWAVSVGDARTMVGLKNLKLVGLKNGR